MAHDKFCALIADDTQANRALLRAYLGRLGFDSLMAEDGEQAVEMYFAHRPDVVLMDLMMPKVDGFEAIRRIRERGGQHWVPIVIVSAMDAEYDVVRGLESGADDFLTKPLSYQVFAAKMRNLARALEFQRSRSEAMQREAAIVAAVRDGIVTFSPSLGIVSANRAAAALFGYTEGAMSGMDVRNLLDGRSNRWDQAFADYMAGVAPEFIDRLMEVQGQRLNRSTFPMEIRVSELPGTDVRLFIAVVRDISEAKRAERQLAENAQRLQQYHDEAESEAELAKEVMERHIRRDALEQSGVEHFVIPTQRFSGDIVLAARSCGGKVYAMLADATGHGLAAAMSGLTIVNDFYRAVESEMPLTQMVLDINNSLCLLLPQGRFVSAALLCIDEGAQHGEIWLGGVPDVLQVGSRGEVITRFMSTHLPLGIIKVEDDEVDTAIIEWSRPGQLLLCSDGVIEATSAEGEVFDYAGIQKAVASCPPAQRLEELKRALWHHLAGQPGHDDISMLLVTLPDQSSDLSSRCGEVAVVSG